jgi:hypothetical protein
LVRICPLAFTFIDTFSIPASRCGSHSSCLLAIEAMQKEGLAAVVVGNFQSLRALVFLACVEGFSADFEMGVAVPRLWYALGF